MMTLMPGKLILLPFAPRRVSFSANTRETELHGIMKDGTVELPRQKVIALVVDDAQWGPFAGCSLSVSNSAGTNSNLRS